MPPHSAIASNDVAEKPVGSLLAYLLPANSKGEGRKSVAHLWLEIFVLGQTAKAGKPRAHVHPLRKEPVKCLAFCAKRQVGREHPH